MISGLASENYLLKKEKENEKQWKINCKKGGDSGIKDAANYGLGLHLLCSKIASRCQGDLNPVVSLDQH